MSSRNLNLRLPFLWLAAVLAVSCAGGDVFRHPPEVRAALRAAGANRPELEGVLEHYASLGDTLKYRAACFLIGHMPGKRSVLPSDPRDPYMGLLRGRYDGEEPEAWEARYSRFGALVDSVSRTRRPKRKIVEDVDTVTCAFLVNNIDLAFAARERRKAVSEVPFDVFCEYVLPYRIGSEPLEDWRSFFLERYGHYLDSLRSGIDIARSIVEDTLIRYNIGMSKFPYPLPVSTLAELRWGDCVQMTFTLASALRALGIPAGVETVPAWANRSARHYWNVVFEGGEAVDVGFDPGAENLIRYKIPKVYRLSFSASEKKLSDGFTGSGVIDVTGEKPGMPVSDLVFKKSGGGRCQLCIFNNARWVPVAESVPGGRTVRFASVGRGIPFGGKETERYDGEGDGIVYLPVRIDGKGHRHSLSPPVILRADGSVSFLQPDTMRTVTAVLRRKYPRYEKIAEYEGMMAGGRFEGSNDAAFKRSEILLRLGGGPFKTVNRASVTPRRAYRYVRYASADSSWADVGDIAFFSGEERLVGKAFSSRSKLDPRLAFDGSIDTYFHVQDSVGAYVGLDFGSARLVTDIRYSPRTDNNAIAVGDTYALFFWDKGWKLFGRKAADADSLVFRGLPSNALFLLHDLGGGTEERIFTLENGRQVWW